MSTAATTTLAASITASLDRFSAAWNAGGSALADFFTSDASLINPFGQRADGRQSISEMYAQYFTGMLAGTTSHIEVHSVRAVGTVS